MKKDDFFVVVLGMSPTGLYAVRELGRAGIEVYVADTTRLAAGYSRYLASSDAWIIESDDGFMAERLLGLAAKQEKAGVLIATSDKYIEFISHQSSRLKASYRFQSSYETGISQLIMDKEQFAKACLEHKIAHPGTWTLSGNELEMVTDEVKFPCILKPNLIHLVKDFMNGQKVLIVRNKEEYSAYVGTIKSLPVRWMVQEIIPGPESNITLFGGYFGRDSELRQPFTCRKLRQYPAGFGSASLVKGEMLDETRTLSERFLKSMGYQGIAGTEFKFDERDEVLKIIEINPRPTLWFGCSSASGKSIILDAVGDMLGMPAIDDGPQITEVYWRYWAKDVSTKIFYRRNGHDFVLPHRSVSEPAFKDKCTWAVYSKDDPSPLFGELKNYFKKAIKRMCRKKTDVQAS